MQSDPALDKVIEQVLSHSKSSQYSNHHAHRLHGAASRQREDNASIADNLQDDYPDFSLYTLAGHLRKLNTSTSGILRLQSFTIRVFSWTKPVITVSVLILTSYLIAYPVLIPSVPILYILLGIMIPAYNERHPTSSIREHHLKNSKHTPPTQLSEEEKKALMKKEQKRVEYAVLERLKDLQNSLGMLVELIEGIDWFVKGPGSFTDEKASTGLFFILLGILSLVYLFSRILSFKIVVICLLWSNAFVLHPWVQREIIIPAMIPPQTPTTLPKQSKEVKLNKTTRINSASLIFIPYKREISKWFKAFSKAEVTLAHDEPAVRIVEIYELHRQGLTKRQWKPWFFTPIIYNINSSLRIKGDRPTPGTRFLSDIQPPEAWVFDMSEQWEIDVDTKGWVHRLGLRDVEIGHEGEGWVYDYNDGERGEWRRRRLVRKCYKM